MTGIKLPLGSGMGCSGGTGTVIVGDQGSGEWSVAIKVSSEYGARGVRRVERKWAQNWFRLRGKG